MVYQAIGGFFSTSFFSCKKFLKVWPRSLLPYRVWVPYFLLNGWLVVAGRRADWGIDVGSGFDGQKFNLVLTSF